ncbi:putative cytochrome P450 phenylacetate 2-hydroxylase, partial [Lentithecium fluviatile CBS 122367]
LQVPGPRGIPIFGSIFELKAGHAKTLDMWTKRYGDMLRVVLGKKEVLILNTRAAVAKTLVKQGAVFQSRPEWNIWHGTFVHSADTGGVLTIGTKKWSSHVADLRKMMAPHTSAQKLPKYNHFVFRRYLRLIKLLADSVSRPRDFGYCWWSTTVGLGTDQLVGHIHDDDFVKLICETEIGTFRLRTLGTPLHDWVPIVNIIEVLINIATAPLKRASALFRVSIPQFDFNAAEDRAEKLRFNQSKYCKKQLAKLVERISNGDTTPSQLGDLFRSLPNQLSDYDQYLLMTTLSGSGMATGTTLSWLTGYLASHPEIQDKAYQALCEVYSGEVPDPHDTDRVEYIKALGLEAGRYWTAVRLGFFRETHEDTKVDGYHIPKGTMVVYNSFQINRDPIGYDSPDQFIPERWMNGHTGRTDLIGASGDKIGVPHMGHGAGRRLCLGVPNVNKTLYGILALTLHFFKLERADLDADSMRTVFPRFRADVGQCSPDMDPIVDQVSTCDAQAVPRAVGICLSSRDPEQLAAWINEGHRSLQDFDGTSGEMAH